MNYSTSISNVIEHLLASYFYKNMLALAVAAITYNGNGLIYTKFILASS